MTGPSATPTLLLDVTGVSKGFPGVQALDDVRLELRHGEVHALVGENGAGKSTLMKLLAGHLQPDAGEFCLERRGTRRRGTPARAGGRDPHHPPGVQPDARPHGRAEHLHRPRAARGRHLPRPIATLNRRPPSCFDRLGLAARPDGTASATSPSREQQMVEIAKALSLDAKVLIMDEPTAALNDAEVEVLFELIRALRAAPTRASSTSRTAWRSSRGSPTAITVLRDGRYIGTRVTAETDSSDEVISLMVGREIVGEQRPAAGAADRRARARRSRASRPRHLLRDVSFELRAGEILGFAGLMGAGRTEVARALVGADRRDGRRRSACTAAQVRSRNPAEAARHRHRLPLRGPQAARRCSLEQERSREHRAAVARATTSHGWASCETARIARDRPRSTCDTLRIKTPSIAQTRARTSRAATSRRS